MIFLKAIGEDDFGDENEYDKPVVTKDLTEFDIRKPWLNTNNFSKDPLSRRNKEKLNKIVRGYCRLLRQLPGDDQNEMAVNVAQIKELFLSVFNHQLGLLSRVFG